MMKPFFTLCLAILVFSLSLILTSEGYAIRENKIIRVGYVDYTKLVEKIDRNGEIQKQVNNLRSSYKSRIDNLQSEVTKLQNDISSDPNAGSIAEKIRDFEQKSIDLELLKIQATQEIESVTSIAFQKINAQIKPIIENIAKKQRFDVIIDRSMVLLASPSLDITSYVLASL